MAIQLLCTGKSEHGYQYKDAEGTTQNGKVIAVNFKYEIDTSSEEAGAVNELFDTKPVLTEEGVEAFVGLQVYPQGFTVYGDDRLTNMQADAVIEFNSVSLGTADIFTNTAVGGVLSTTGGGGEV